VAALAAAFAVSALSLAACAPDASKQRSLSPDEIPPALAGRPLAIVEIGDRQLRVAVADTADTRGRGLMGIDDFGAVDGMVFVYTAPTETSFFMKDVLVPLDIAFVGADRTVLAVLTMAICESEPCPTYRSPAPFVWALETPSGRLAGVEPGDRFSLRP
jgi:uncharacterized protein